jgi:hypothetical protein
MSQRISEGRKPDRYLTCPNSRDWLPPERFVDFVNDQLEETGIDYKVKITATGVEILVAGEDSERFEQLMSEIAGMIFQRVH